MGPWSNMAGALIRIAHRGKAMWRQSKNMAICKQRKEASLGITLLISWSWTCSLQKLWEKKCLLLTLLSLWRFVMAVRGDKDLISIKPHKTLWGMSFNKWTGLPCWLRTCLLVLGSMVWSLVWEDSTCHRPRLVSQPLKVKCLEPVREVPTVRSPLPSAREKTACSNENQINT